MSISDLLAILEMIPEKSLVNMILEYMQGQFFRGYLSEAEAFASYIIEHPTNTDLTAGALAIGVKTALRERKIPLALERYEMLLNMPSTFQVQTSRADALFQLAVSLIPDKMTVIVSLWKQSLEPDMPHSVQRVFADAGILLVKQFRRNRDMESAEVLESEMNHAFADDICKNVQKKLAR